MKYIVLLLIVSRIYGQGPDIDSMLLLLEEDLSIVDRAKTLHEITGHYVKSDPDSCIIYAREAYQLTQTEGLDSLHGQSITNLVGALFTINEIDSAKVLLLSSLDFHRSRDDHKLIATTYRNLATIGEAKKEPDSTLHYVDLCLAVLAEHPDSSLLGDAYYSKSFAYQTKGYYDLAVQAILEAARIFEAKEDKFKMGFMYHMLNTNFSRMEKYDEAIEWNEKCIAQWEEIDYKVALVHAYNNMGGDLKNQEKDQKAIKWHLKANALCKEVNQEYVQMLSAFNLAELYIDHDQLDSARTYIDEALPLAQSMEVPFILAGLDLSEARLRMKQGNRSVRPLLAQAKKQLNAQVDPSEKVDLLEAIADIEEELNQHTNALTAFKELRTLEDSLLNAEKNTKFEELNLIYETEKKDAEIQLLAKNVELEQTKKRSLIGGLILLFLAAGSTILALVQRSRKNKQIHQQEKQLEIQKRETAEKELEFKKKELTAKALQLASKNEFLQKLEEQVSDLKSSVDSTVSKTSQRISRMIMMDGQEDEEWDQFSKEFSSVHSGYLDRLREQFGSFSTSETRLISLMKMNLSSKDIANILRISADGVKKARYRLRKKMQLDSDVDIQQYLINY